MNQENTTAYQNYPNCYNPNRVLDVLIEKMNVEDDAAFARKLNVATRVITMMREGRLCISASMALWLHEASGVSLQEIKELSADRRAKYRLTCK